MGTLDILKLVYLHAQLEKGYKGNQMGYLLQFLNIFKILKIFSLKNAIQLTEANKQVYKDPPSVSGTLCSLPPPPLSLGFATAILHQGPAFGAIFLSLCTIFISSVPSSPSSFQSSCQDSGDSSKTIFTAHK